MFQVKIQQGGVWSAGICTPAADLNTDLGLDQTSWAVTSSGQVRTRNSQEYKVNLKLEEGDVLGFTYDHVELNVYCNGTNLDTPVLGIKGTVFPVFYGESLKFIRNFSSSRNDRTQENIWNQSRFSILPMGLVQNKQLTLRLFQLMKELFLTVYLKSFSNLSRLALRGL